MPIQKEKRPRMAPSTPTTSSSSTTAPEGWPSSVNSRAERSRHAAKMRRDKETEEISALSKLLPYPEEVTRRLDKGSIIRLTTSYLRMKKFSQREGTALLDELKKKAITAGPEKDAQQPQVNEGALMLQALNGFIIFVSRKGNILYVAENVGKQIGIHQYDMIGHSIMDFIHPDDQKELAKQFVVQFPGHQTFKGYGMEKLDDSPTAMNINFFDEAKIKDESPGVTDYIQDRNFFLRMKSVVSRRSIGGKGKVIGYRVVNFTGRLKLKGSNNSKGYCVEGLICLCRPIQPQPILEIRMDGNMFMSRHALDMSFTFCDPRIITLVGYEPHEVIGKTAYQFHNPMDARKVSDCHSKLIVKGSSMSKYYRFLGKLGEWVWMQTKATIIYNTNNVAQYVVCMNYVIGKDEGERHLLMEQMQQSFEGSLSDSDCGSPHTPGTPSSMGIGSCSDSEDLSSPKIVELREEDLAKLVPQPVRENQVILKPEDESSKVSFKDLVRESKAAKENKEAAVPMDVCVKAEGEEEKESEMQCDDSMVNVGASCSTAVDHDDPVLPRNVPCSQVMKADSPASDVDSMTSSGSGSVCSPPSQDRKSVSSFGEAEERELLNLLEITGEKDLPSAEEANFSISALSFTVPSPDNLSQILNSPGTTSSLCPDAEVHSPNMSWLEDDVFCPDKLKSPANNILLNLLNEPPITDKLLKQESNQTIKQFLLSSVVGSDTRTGSALPADLADFSLEYASPAGCPQAGKSSDTLGDMSLCDGVQSQNSGGATICEVVGPQVTAALNNATLSPSVSAAQPTATPQYSNATAAAPSFVTPTCNGQSIPPVSNGTQAQTQPCDSHGVTEGMSKLDIQDLANQSQKSMHSMLKALLTGAEINPLSLNQLSAIPDQLRLPISNGVENVSDLLGPITPSTRTAVETVESLMQDHVGVGRDLSINNNRINHDDLTLLQRQQQQKKILQEDFLRKQQLLLESHRQQQQILEEEHRRQLLQRHAMQQQMIASKQMQLKMANGAVQPNGLQQNGMPHNGLPQGGILQNGMAQNGMQQNGLQQQQQQNGSVLQPNENHVDIADLGNLDFQQQLNAVVGNPQQQQQQHFQTNGAYSPPQNYQHIPTQHQNGFSRQSAPFQQGSPPLGMPHATQQQSTNSFPTQAGQSSLLAACLMGQTTTVTPAQQLQQQQQQQQQQQAQPIQQSLPPSFHPAVAPMPGFSQQSNPISCTSTTLTASDWQAEQFSSPMGAPGRGFVNGQTGPITGLNNFPETCALQQPLQF
ncbi:uncharacterized protein [Diadema antillarum]|uniref:uncharacterized protein n=1 Tax=Diadema antillarum TaxID=105358 RepID=UPI003A85B7B1